MTDPDLLEAARGDEAAFGRLVQPYRRELHAHCYRMLGCVQDAEDAVQNALLGAWQGIGGFEGRSSVRSWLYRIATNASLRLAERAPKRLLAREYGPPRTDTRDLGAPVTESVWIEPYPDDLLEGGLDPEARYELRESVELAFVAALQHLPATQRAVVILRDVLAFSAAEVAELLETSVASVNSALQRARKSLDDRVGGPSQQAVLRDLGEDKQRELVDAFVTAWEQADVPALLELLTEDARFTMPPLPAWFSGREAVGRFLRERVAETRWKLFPINANGQLAFVSYQGEHGADVLAIAAITVLTISEGRIQEITGFIDPATFASFGPAERITVA